MTDKHFLNWARVLATEYGGEMTPVSEEDLHLEGSSERWEKILGSREPILLSLNPEDPDAWRARLLYVEKRAAQAVISAPAAFSCSVPGTGRRQGHGNGPVEVVRFAFGLSLSFGPSCRRRFTAYYLKDAGRAFTIAGQDKLFETCTGIGAVGLRNKEVINGLRHILDVIPEAKREYEDSEPIQRQIELLKKALSSELRDLDRLYLAGQGQYGQLLGKATEPLKGDDAIELEYFSRMEDIVRKYGISVCFAPLSLGLVRCNVQIKKKKEATEVAIPFVAHPFYI